MLISKLLSYLFCPKIPNSTFHKCRLSCVYSNISCSCMLSLNKVWVHFQLRPHRNSHNVCGRSTCSNDWHTCKCDKSYFLCNGGFYGHFYRCNFLSTILQSFSIKYNYYFIIINIAQYLIIELIGIPSSVISHIFPQ